MGGRANLIGDPNAGIKSHDHWFNTAAFATPAFGTIGQYCCNRLLGPADPRLDLSIRKSTNVRENLRLIIAGEFFNFTNTLQFGPPDGNMRSPTFGRTLGPAGLGAGIVRAPQLSSRIVQLGARIEF